MSTWQIFRGDGTPRKWEMPPAPPWRQFTGQPVLDATYDDSWSDQVSTDLERAKAYRADPREVELVNVAILLRRPLLVTGKPGTGKSTLAHAIARELDLGPVLHWPITSRSSLQDGLYRYDAIARLQDANIASAPANVGDIGRYLQLGPLGTALLPTRRPRVVLVDELDKSDVDLPNDLLNVLEEGQFRIPELIRIADTEDVIPVGVEHRSAPVPVHRGTVRCSAFPIVIMTSNGQRDFPAAFLRRCIRLDIAEPTAERLRAIVEAHLGAEAVRTGADIIDQFLNRRTVGELATDQLLNALFLTLSADVHGSGDRAELASLVLRQLSNSRPGS